MGAGVPLATMGKLNRPPALSVAEPGLSRFGGVGRTTRLSGSKHLPPVLEADIWNW